jgi:hypothetical protein
VPALKLPGKHIDLELSDSDPRAVSYVAGTAPNLWGYLADGSTVAEKVAKADKKASEYDQQRRSHPLFANVALALVAEILNRRLFSTVRERKQLTYDANFSFTGFERLKGGWFLVTVTASKENAQKALDACKETLHALRKSNPISPDNLESAKRKFLATCYKFIIKKRYVVPSAQYDLFAVFPHFFLPLPLPNRCCP